mmetsp:Transcript_60474/g.112287  ORF Transcript_60474/g.112287 Transcript_60474/m.112287 type:complete len:323 (-) Transcript_60474:33-1001(-)
MTGLVDVGLITSTPPGLDWPLSGEEKKNCLLQLFSKDVQVANEVIRSGEVKLRELELELQRAVDATGQEQHVEQAEPVQTETTVVMQAPPSLAQPQPVHDESSTAAAKLRQAIASATAALEALEQAQDCKPQDDEWERPPETLVRARSEGNLVGILCKDAKLATRSASAGHRQRRVSFGPSDCEDDLANERGEEPEPEMFTPDCSTGRRLPKEGWCPSIKPMVLPSYMEAYIRGRDQRSNTPRSRGGATGVAQRPQRNVSGDGRGQHRGADTRRSSGGVRGNGSCRQEPTARNPSHERTAEGAAAPAGTAERPRRIWRSRGT